MANMHRGKLWDTCLKIWHKIVRYKVVSVSGRYIRVDTEIFSSEDWKNILQFIHTYILQGEISISKSIDKIL